MTVGQPAPCRECRRATARNLSRSRVSWRTSFLVSPAVSPASCSSRRLVALDRARRWSSSWSACRRASDGWDVMLGRTAPRGFGDRPPAPWRLVPTNSTLPPAAVAWRTKSSAACEQGHGLRQVKDMDAVAVAEDVRLHLRIPAMGLMPEMGAGLEQGLHRDDGSRHRIVYFRLCLRGRNQARRPAPVYVPTCEIGPRLSRNSAQIKLDRLEQNMKHWGTRALVNGSTPIPKGVIPLPFVGSSTVYGSFDFSRLALSSRGLVSLGIVARTLVESWPSRDGVPLDDRVGENRDDIVLATQGQDRAAGIGDPAGGAAAARCRLIRA